ncbi:hypothetical protein F0L68_13080 [Solihabitans fulvus]|uniref:Uncharacterized protein n=1 Tax=Solihabitans fulvus TaxID=1892852 RepID=A0A5B2XEK1_9PSEU|nr:hypothetical protein [Solihabitans fulvus]KAA2262218.1 hypothetical protein F0L68_13080 [Solihabitans fulvus]
MAEKTRQSRVTDDLVGLIGVVVTAVGLAGIVLLLSLSPGSSIGRPGDQLAVTCSPVLSWFDTVAESYPEACGRARAATLGYALLVAIPTVVAAGALTSRAVARVVLTRAGGPTAPRST